MEEVTGLWLALFVMVAFPICCGLFCLWVDTRGSYVDRIIRKKERDYWRRERRQRTKRR